MSPSTAPLPSDRIESRPWFGPRLFVSNEASGDVSVIELPANDVVATIPVGKRHRGIQRSPDGMRVYVALSGRSPSARAKGSAQPDRSADGSAYSTRRAAS
jgi:YVTN family beta-propeller protein